MSEFTERGVHEDEVLRWVAEWGVVTLEWFASLMIQFIGVN